MSKTKVREFWTDGVAIITQDEDYIAEIIKNDLWNKPPFKVIEYSRVTELEAECNGLESLRREEQLMRHAAQDKLEKVRAERDSISKKFNDSIPKIALMKMEVGQHVLELETQLAAAKANRDHWYKEFVDLEVNRASCCMEMEAKLKIAEEALAKLGATK